MCLFTRAVVCSVLFLVSLSRVAQADTIALSSSSGGFLATSSVDQLYGWVFTANAPITVTALGVFESGTGLGVSHDVGIFNQSSEALLGSVVVPAGSGGTLIDGYDFASVSPFSLAQGATYVIVMTMPSGNTDDQRILATSETTASEITYDNSAFDDASALAFPAGVGEFAPGIFGPDFTFTDASVAITPEPSSIALLGTGLLTVASLVRRRFVRG
jgi:PEP-CTERM motif